MFKVVDPKSSVYVEFSINGQACVQEFASGEERAFVVGSTERANLRVKAEGIAPVQFHVEREDGAIWLIPAYGIADLSVDGARVFGPTPLDASSVIEFCGVRVDAKIVEADPLAADDDRLSAPKLDAQMSREAYARSVPSEDDPTLLAMHPVPPSESVPEETYERPTRPNRARAEHKPIAPGRPPTEPRWSLWDDDVPARADHLEIVTRRLSPTPKQVAPVHTGRSRTPTKTPLLVAGAVVGVLLLALIFLVATGGLQGH